MIFQNRIYTYYNYNILCLSEGKQQFVGWRHFAQKSLDFMPLFADLKNFKKNEKKCWQTGSGVVI